MKRISLLSVFFIVALISFGQQNFWTPVNEADLNKNLFADRQKPNAYKLFALNEPSFKSMLRAAPSEKNTPVSKSFFIISVPNAEGQLEQFKVVEAPVMHSDLAARYPGIHSYTGKGINDPAASIRFDVSPQGFHGMILSAQKPTVYIDPIDQNTGYYLVVSRKDIINYRSAFECLTKATTDASLKVTTGAATKNADDATLRTYRLALCATGEFSQYWLNGTETTDAQRKAKVLAAQNTEMTRANGIFERDFGLRLVLVANNDAVIYLNSSTDPWSSNNLNSATQTTCDNVIGNANYDIGHLVHRASDNGNAGCIACVCKSGSKGSGFTSYLNLSSDYFVVDYLTHEMGHQLGGNHTFTFSNEGTIAQVEPGSGSTIMGYAGITGSTDVQPHSDDYFHAISIQQVTNYIKSATGGCAVSTSIGNSTPTASAGADYVIPKSTPFILTGSGTDADAGDILTYCWEQNNPRATGTSTIPSATATSGPQFRSYLPIATTTSRTFPILSSILSGNNSNQWEVLPSVNRTLNFRFTVRDNHAGGGNNNSDDMIVTVSGAVGPFAVTAPNTAITWGIGSSQTVSWSVNGTTGSPVNCANVNILLSTDGGQTFPIVLAGNTSNDGSQIITVPDNAGNTNRVKVEAVGNIFFDISNTNFTIGTAPACADPSGLNTTGITSNSATLNWVANGATSYDVDYKLSSASLWTNAATAAVSTSVTLSGLTASTSYDWRVRANCTSASSNYSVSGFITSTAGSSCPGSFDISTNGNTSGAATIPLNTDIKGTISSRSDNDYYKFSITTGGTISVSLTTLPANYDLSLLNSAGTLVASSTNNGTTNETINATVVAGNYFARVYPKGNASNASNCYTLRVQTGTANRNGNDLITGSKVNAFPNPAGNTLQVYVEGLVKKADIRVTDISGKVVMKTILTGNSKLLDVSRLAGGVYFLSVHENGETKRIKFVKE